MKTPDIHKGYFSPKQKIDPEQYSLQDFLAKYDIEGSIVLLEGKRDVPQEEQKLLEALGKLLVTHSKYITFRSGNASGADEWFSKGVCEVSPERMEVIRPYAGHRDKKNQAYITHDLDDISLASEPRIIYQSKANKKTEKLIDKYVGGARDQFALKAAYIIRDTVKVIGTKTIPPASFAFFYDDLKNPKTGGTGHTMDICEKNLVPYFTQKVWMKWVEGVYN
jgi:hypothetical protein